MSIFKLKFEAHRLVNLLFYGVVFILGFLFGLGIKQIDLNKYISNFLMIENVSAMTIVESGSLVVDEEYIYNEMFNDTGYSYEDYPHIVCNYIYYSGDNSTGAIVCYSFSSIDELETSNFSSYNENFQFSIVKPFLHYKITFTKSTGEIKSKLLTTSDNVSATKTFGYYGGNNSTSNAKNKTFTNFDFVKGASLSTINSKVNKLDFSIYSKLEFNENLFENNPLFKKECVKNYDTFSITTDFWMGEEDNKYYQGDDFIIFPHGVTGLKVYFYDNQSSGNYKEIDKKGLYGNNYWFNSKENIDNYFDSKIPGDLLFIGNYSNKMPDSNELNSNAYFNRYKYYDYTFYPFKIDLKGDKMEFNIFEFKSPGVNYIDSDNVDYPDEYCFYIKGRYNVNILDRDEFGDVYGTVVTPNGNVDVNISYNQDSINNVGIFSTITNFMSKIRGTVHFINQNIYDFYQSMPLIVRMFVMSVLGLFIVKFIIDMVVK